MRGISLSIEQAARLRGELKQNENVTVYRRSAALLALHEGQTVTQVAELLGVTRQSIYNWIATYGSGDENLDLRDAPRTGRPPLVTEELKRALAAACRQTPAELGYAAENWTANLLREHLVARCERRFSDETLRLHLGRLGYVWRDRRYVLEPNERPAETRPVAVDAPC